MQSRHFVDNVNDGVNHFCVDSKTMMKSVLQALPGGVLHECFHINKTS